ncbi:hypothetical protein TRFO_02399 [Tritrichomonas foetus]|uniref:Uncharacterized protein n=1 Tax=Tritrichomonas foetus TaxID=1144522 RepID=A0A1J4J592_9EUKA|nr:hypothetical protein TRFO_02399 [Tritrichomonas foetus]|eukprot:OHS93865.1 hypothetical protein TRFO_02399 [Tritrichomonas foetus]
MSYSNIFEYYCQNYDKKKMDLSYKEETPLTRNKPLSYLEYLANELVEHKYNENQTEISFPSSIEGAIECLINGSFSDQAIVYLSSNIHRIQQNDNQFIEHILQTNVQNYIIPFATVETEYTLLLRTLQVLRMLTSISSSEDDQESSFQNPAFAHNLTTIIIEMQDQPTIIKNTIKLINSLLIHQNFSESIFLNFIHAKLPSVIKNSQIFHIDPSKIKIQNAKIIIHASKLLVNLAYFCKVEYLAMFTPFYEEINHFLVKSLKFDKKERAKLNFLELLSIMLKFPNNRTFAYNFHIPEMILEILRTHKGEFLKFSFDAINEIASNDGLHPCFQTMAFYNLTRNALQNAKSHEILMSIFQAIESLFPLDWDNLWTNEIISDIFDIMTMDHFEDRVESARLIVIYFQTCGNLEYLIEAIKTGYFTNIFEIFHCISENQLCEVLDIMYELISRSYEVVEAFRQVEEVGQAMIALKEHENETVAQKAAELYDLINDYHLE